MEKNAHHTSYDVGLLLEKNQKKKNRIYDFIIMKFLKKDIILIDSLKKKLLLLYHIILLVLIPLLRVAVVVFG